MDKEKIKKIRKLAKQQDPQLSYSEIGRVVGTSKQYIHQIVTGYHSPAWRKINKK